MKTFYDWCIENNREDLLKEWHVTKNNDLKPENVSYGSNKRVWWRCDKGHEWLASPKDRKKRNCPYCCNQKILRGYNDLVTTNPELLKEWNFEKNINVSPYEIGAGTHKKVWWRCDNGHEWQASIVHRKNGRSCPYCSNKKVLKGYNDLATTHPHLVSEWNFDKNKDLTPNDVVSGSSKKVWWKCKRGHEWQVSPNQRIYYNSNCPYCSNNKVLKGYNDLASTHPHLLKEWDFEKNKGLSPYEVIAGSNKRVWWKCKKGHEWQASIQMRALEAQKCPYCCNQKILKGYNDLTTTNPELLKEWNFEKNINVSPYEIGAGTSKKVWWKCQKGHEWQASVVSRKNGTGCPYCSGKKILSGYNDFATKNPKLIKEWDYNKNIIKPNTIAESYKERIWWKCSKCGYEWQAKIISRIRGAKCPHCKSI